MIVKINNDWKDVKNTCRTTVNKDHTDNEPSDKFKHDILITEHSPIRLISIRFIFKGIKSWVATHFSRHKWECFISTNRSDRIGKDRGTLSQDSPVNLDGEANAQALIDTSRKRLCFEASTETRREWEQLKKDIFKAGEEELSNCLVPNGIYRGGCPEVFSKCTYCVDLLEKLDNNKRYDLKEKNKVYNESFWSRKGE